MPFHDCHSKFSLFFAFPYTTTTTLNRSNQFEPNQFQKGPPINKSQYSSIFNATHLHTSQSAGRRTDLGSASKSLAQTAADQLSDNELDADEKARINNRFEQKGFDAANRALNLSKQTMARKADPEQSDLDTFRDRDSRPDSRQSDLASEPSEIETASDEEEDEADEELDDDKELESYDDNELDKDFRQQLGRKLIKNDYYPPHPNAKFINGSSLPAQIALHPTAPHAKSGAPYSTPVQMNSILPHYVPNHLASSAANSDKYSISADNHRLSKKAKELRKTEYKREYQRLDNQPYIMHSPSQNTSNPLHSNHTNASVKSGCNL